MLRRKGIDKHQKPQRGNPTQKRQCSNLKSQDLSFVNRDESLVVASPKSFFSKVITSPPNLKSAITLQMFNTWSSQISKDMHINIH